MRITSTKYIYLDLFSILFVTIALMRGYVVLFFSSLSLCLDNRILHVVHLVLFNNMNHCFMLFMIFFLSIVWTHWCDFRFTFFLKPVSVYILNMFFVGNWFSPLKEKIKENNVKGYGQNLHIISPSSIFECL
jgi:hypothetical protein